jgi:hypothetical protein
MKWLGGSFLRGERALLLSGKAPVFVTGDNNVTTNPNGLAQGALCAAEHLRSLRMAVFSCEF